MDSMHVEFSYHALQRFTERTGRPAAHAEAALAAAISGGTMVPRKNDSIGVLHGNIEFVIRPTHNGATVVTVLAALSSDLTVTLEAASRYMARVRSCPDRNAARQEILGCLQSVPVEKRVAARRSRADLTVGCCVLVCQRGRVDDVLPLEWTRRQPSDHE